MLTKISEFIKSLFIKKESAPFFQWKTFNDQFALFLMLAIIIIWICNRWLEIPAEVNGALILAFGSIVQFYFRKKENGN